MKRIIMRDKLTRKYVVITKSIQNDCFVNKHKVDNIGFYELVDSYKKAGYKIIRCYSGTVNEWGNMCDMNDLTSELSIYDRHSISKYGEITDYKMVLLKVIHILTVAIKANSTSKAEKMLLRTIVADICRYAAVNYRYASVPMTVLKQLKNVMETPAITVLKRDLAELLNTSHF